MKKRFPLILLIVLLLLAAGAAFVLFFTGRPVMDENAILCIEKKEEGGMILSWPECEKAYDYHVEVYSAYAGPAESYLVRDCMDTRCILPAGIPADKAITISVMPRKRIGFKKAAVFRNGIRGVSVTAYLHDNTGYDLSWKVDPDNKTFTASFSGGSNDCYNLYRKKDNGGMEVIRSLSYKKSFTTAADGSLELKSNPGAVQMVITFGEGGDFPLPAQGERISFVMDASRTADHLMIKETVSEAVSLSRDDFTDTVLNLSCEEKGDNRYVLSWNETVGEGYLVQCRTGDGNWQTVAEIAPSDERVYETGHLKSFRDYSFRVCVKSSNGEYVEPAVAAFRTAVSETYATVWPMQDTTLWADEGKKEKSANVSALQALCVTGLTGDMFKVYTPDGDAYIEQNSCMINLSDYLGDLCEYDITNSYYSIYAAHEYAIPYISGEVTEGYENVLMENNEFLAPLLYPTAKKLMGAAMAALNDGYRIKIYDSFRPYIATRSIYDITEAVLDLPLPAEKFERLELHRYQILKEAGYVENNGSGYEEMREALAADPNALLIKALSERYGAMDDAVPLEYRLDPSSPFYDPNALLYDSYRTEMLGTSYRLSAFLAQKGSAHNLGIALDMTLEDVSTGEELVMQSAMHDLSYHSIQSKNNNNANILKSYMTAAGFNMITSEWWHFQDDDTRNKVKPPRVEQGVSPEGYVVDDKGVYYRRADGSMDQ